MARKLPPMKALIAFESVVRLGSVTKAADDLSVTHGAVSKQIAALEDWIGRPLFQKSGKYLSPTEDGVALARVADQALQQISAALSEMDGAQGATILKVIAPSTFAMRWLIPRAWNFSKQHQQIAIQVRQTDSLENWLDIPFDVAIRPTSDARAGLAATPFLSERLILAVAPAFGPLRDPADLECGQFLAAATRPGELESWCAAACVDRDTLRITSFPHFYLALEAALAGLGPLVCPLETLGDLLRRGDLVEPFPHIRVAGPTYAAFYDPGTAHARAAHTFVGWLATRQRLIEATQQVTAAA